MKRAELGWRSPLAEGIEAFLEHKRALGRRFANEEKILRLLDRYLVEQQVHTIDQVTPTVLDAFFASRRRASARSHNQLLGGVRRLLDWLVIQDRLAVSPLRAQPRRAADCPRPFLFDKSQVKSLLDAASQLAASHRAPRRGETYAMIFSLLYALGLRVGEATRLCREEVDLDRQLLFIRQTKFGKSRLVPFGPRLGERLSHYIHTRASYVRPIEAGHALFCFAKDPYQPISPTTVSWTFHKLVLELGFTAPCGVATPHLHCLRHSFAVSTLLRWYRAGIDPSERLLYLSTFLGHVSPASTAVYLTITDELLELAGERFRRFAAPALREVRR